MADDQDHYFRLVTFVVEGCVKPLVQQFLHQAKSDTRTGVPYTNLDNYLNLLEPTFKYLKQRKIIRQNQYDLVFPQTGVTDIIKWDITLLSTLLQNIFTLSQAEEDYIKDIRNVRNELCHLSHKAEVNDQDFTDKWDKLEKAVTELGKCCSYAVHVEMKDYVKALKIKALSPPGPIIEKLKEWYNIDNNLGTISNDIKSTLDTAEASKQAALASKQTAMVNKETSLATKRLLEKGSVASYTSTGAIGHKKFKVVDNVLENMKVQYERTVSQWLPNIYTPPEEVNDIKIKLQQHHRVVVSGSGNSKHLPLALYAIKELGFKANRCVHITKAADWSTVCYEDVDLILCVDPFGAKSYNRTRAKAMAENFDRALADAKEEDSTTRISIVIVTNHEVLHIFKKEEEHELLSIETAIDKMTTVAESSDTDDEDNQHERIENIDPVLTNLLVQSRTLIQHYSRDESSLSKLQEAHEMFQEKKTIVISGQRRSGKTLMAVRLMLPHSIERCLIVTDPSNWKHVSLESIDVLLIEDFCGKFGFERELARDWLRNFDFIYAAVREGKLQVIITCTPDSLRQCRQKVSWHYLLEESVLSIDEEQKPSGSIDAEHKQPIETKQTTNSPNSSNVKVDKVLEKPLVTSLKEIDKTDGLVDTGNKQESQSVFRTVSLSRQFDAAVDEDSEICNFRGMFYCNGYIYIADKDNDKIKVFHDNGDYIAHTSINEPRDVTDIGSGRVAASNDSNTISLFSLDVEQRTLTLYKTFDTEIKTFGIALYKDHLYAICKADKINDNVHVFTMNGKATRRIEPLSDGVLALQYSFKIAINQNTGIIYVTDWKKGIIVFNQKGIVKHVTRMFRNLDTAWGLAGDEYGQIYVCGVNSNSVMKIQHDGSELVEIMGKEQDCYYPRAISISGNKLALCCDDTNIVQIYTLS